MNAVRLNGMYRVALVVVFGLALSACGPSNVSAGGSASCAGPYLSSRSPEHPGKTARTPPKTFEPGQVVDVYGHWYTSTCNDTNHDHDPLVPLPDVTLTVVLPGGDSIHVGPFAPAGSDMGFHAQFTIPASTSSGPATVTDDSRPTISSAAYEFNVSTPAG